MRAVDQSLLRHGATTRGIRTDVRDARVRAFECCGEVGAITSDPSLDVERVRHGGVGLALPHAHGKHHTLQCITGHRGQARAGGEITGLPEGLVLEVSNELLTSRQQVGDLPRRDRRVARGSRVEQPGVLLRNLRGAVRAIPPRFVFFQIPAHVRIEIPETLQPIDIPHVEARPARDAERDLTGVDIGGGERIVLEVRVETAVIRVASGLADVLAQSARHRHCGVLPDGRDGNLRERREVGEVVVVRAVGPADTNAFNLIAVHPRGRPQSIGRVLLQGERPVTAHVHFRKRHARRVRHDREEVARARQSGERVAIEMGRDRC